jgi:hypothetical protein
MNALRDIYILEKHIREEKYNNTKRSRSDNSNLISLKTSQNQFIMSREELQCDNCEKRTVYIHNINGRGICPVCAYKILPSICENCYRSNGCASCGGCPKKMIKLDNGLICAQDKCLMPFGYCLQIEDYCTCHIDAYKEMKKSYFKPLFNLMSSYIGPVLITRYDKSIPLADLSYTDAHKCVPCQLAKKYKIVTDNMITSNNLFCDCAD